MWVRITRKVTVTGGAIAPAGAELDLPAGDARLLIGAGKAIAIPDPAPAPAPVKAEKPPKAEKAHKAETKPAPVDETAATEQETVPC